MQGDGARAPLRRRGPDGRARAAGVPVTAETRALAQTIAERKAFDLGFAAAKASALQKVPWAHIEEKRWVALREAVEFTFGLASSRLHAKWARASSSSLETLLKYLKPLIETLLDNVQANGVPPAALQLQLQCLWNLPDAFPKDAPLADPQWLLNLRQALIHEMAQRIVVQGDLLHQVAAPWNLAPPKVIRKDLAGPADRALEGLALYLPALTVTMLQRVAGAGQGYPGWTPIVVINEFDYVATWVPEGKGGDAKSVGPELLRSQSPAQQRRWIRFVSALSETAESLGIDPSHVVRWVRDFDSGPRLNHPQLVALIPEALQHRSVHLATCLLRLVQFGSDVPLGPILRSSELNPQELVEQVLLASLTLHRARTVGWGGRPDLDLLAPAAMALESGLRGRLRGLMWALVKEPACATVPSEEPISRLITLPDGRACAWTEACWSRLLLQDDLDDLTALRRHVMAFHLACFQIGGDGAVDDAIALANHDGRVSAKELAAWRLAACHPFQYLDQRRGVETKQADTGLDMEDHQAADGVDNERWTLFLEALGLPGALTPQRREQLYKRINEDLGLPVSRRLDLIGLLVNCPHTYLEAGPVAGLRQWLLAAAREISDGESSSSSAPPHPKDEKSVRPVSDPSLVARVPELWLSLYLRIQARAGLGKPTAKMQAPVTALTRTEDLITGWKLATLEQDQLEVFLKQEANETCRAALNTALVALKAIIKNIEEGQATLEKD